MNLGWATRSSKCRSGWWKISLIFWNFEWNTLWCCGVFSHWNKRDWKSVVPVGAFMEDIHVYDCLEETIMEICGRLEVMLSSRFFKRQWTIIWPTEIMIRQFFQQCVFSYFLDNKEQRLVKKCRNCVIRLWHFLHFPYQSFANKDLRLETSP